MKTWMMIYKGALLHFPKMMKASVVELKAMEVEACGVHTCDPVYWDSHPGEDKGIDLTRT